MLAASFPVLCWEGIAPCSAVGRDGTSWLRMGPPGLGWDLLAPPPGLPSGGSASGEASKTGALYWTRRRSPKELRCPEETCLEKGCTLLIWAIPSLSVKMKEQIFTFIPLSEPSEILGGKGEKSHCISLHPFSDIEVAALIFLSGLAISCPNPLRVQWWDSKKKLLLSGSGYCWCLACTPKKTLVTCPLVFFRIKLRDNKMSTYCAIVGFSRNISKTVSAFGICKLQSFSYIGRRRDNQCQFATDCVGGQGKGRSEGETIISTEGICSNLTPDSFHYLKWKDERKNNKKSWNAALPPI